MTGSERKKLAGLRTDYADAELRRLDAFQRFGVSSSEYISAARDVAEIERRIAKLQAK